MQNCEYVQKKSQNFEFNKRPEWVEFGEKRDEKYYSFVENGVIYLHPLNAK